MSRYRILCARERRRRGKRSWRYIIQQELSKRLSVHKQCFIKRKIIPAFHVLVEICLVIAPSYGQTPLSSTKTKIYMCACVYWSCDPEKHSMNQSSWLGVYRGPPGQLAHRGTMPARCRGELCWVCSSFCSWGSDTMEFSSLDEVTQQIRNEHTRQSPYIRAFLKPGKSSYTHTCQSGESHQWRRGNR